MKNKGITLVALVITIVIILILAGVALNLTIGENGLIAKAKTTKNIHDNAVEEEQAKLAELEAQIGEILNGGTRITFSQAKESSMLTKTDNTELAVTDGTVTIPAGYMVAEDSGETIDEGIVITDASSNGNEWVWVPVNDTFYETGSVAITGGSGKTYISGVTATKYSKSEILSGIERGLPNSSVGREPDVVVGTGSQYDGACYNDPLGYSDKNAWAQAVVDEYNQMVDSLEQYHGFWIGRYELSSAGVKKGGTTLTSTNWYDLYIACKNLSADSTKSISRMIWGCQWDLTCKYIESNDSGYSITDSTSWGNYSNSSGDAIIIVGESYKNGVKQVTGYSEYWKAKNIYDFAGNCSEWTQEAGKSKFRCARGGSCHSNGIISAVGEPAAGSVNHTTTTDTYESDRYSPSINKITN